MLAIAAVAYACTVRETPLKGAIERITIHGRSLDGNLAGDPPTRAVSVYLPPSYGVAPHRRFPVVYVLHGLMDNDEQWFGGARHFINVPRAVDRALDNGGRELIVVAPNARTRFGGSMFSRGVTIGDWEGFMARDLVAAIDQRYRTLPAPDSRGLAGHSMGGYGVLRLGMKYPEVFSALYAQSPCCIEIGAAQATPDAESVTTFDELENAAFDVRVQFAWAAAWSPNPQKPPFFLDLPFQEGQLRPEVIARWAANSPLQLVEEHLENLRRIKALAIDAGSGDGLSVGVRALDDLLNRHGLPHAAEIYSGDHTNRIQDRFEKQVLPFFSRHLVFE